MAYVQWSFSSLKTFKTCARQYKHKYILKDVTDDGNEATRYGSAVHEAIENFLKDGTPLPAAFLRYLPLIAPCIEWEGQMLVEFEMALGPDLQPCEFRDPHYFVRGIADFVKVNGTTAYILDWKTSKSARYADTKQLELMALMLFKHFPQVTEVKAGLVFLVADKVVRSIYKAADAKSMWLRWLHDISRVEHAIDNDQFTPNPNNLCRAFCPVMSCEFNGRLE